jgi:lactoylglutathione lyase
MASSSSNQHHSPGPYVVGEHILPPQRPSSPETAEYSLNHLMLRIEDPKESLRFYCDCMGLHVVFIFNAGPWTIYVRNASV